MIHDLNAEIERNFLFDFLNLNLILSRVQTIKIPKQNNDIPSKTSWTNQHCTSWCTAVSAPLMTPQRMLE